MSCSDPRLARPVSEEGGSSHVLPDHVSIPEDGEVVPSSPPSSSTAPDKIDCRSFGPLPTSQVLRIRPVSLRGWGTAATNTGASAAAAPKWGRLEGVGAPAGWRVEPVSIEVVIERGPWLLLPLPLLLLVLPRPGRALGGSTLGRRRPAPTSGPRWPAVVGR